MVCGLDAEDPTDLILYCISKAQCDAWLTVSMQQRGNRGVAWMDKPYPDPADSLYFKLFIYTIHSIFQPARNLLGSWAWAHFPCEALYSSLNWSLSIASSIELQLIYYRPPLTVPLIIFPATQIGLIWYFTRTEWKIAYLLSDHFKHRCIIPTAQVNGKKAWSLSHPETLDEKLNEAGISSSKETKLRLILPLECSHLLFKRKL